MLIMIRSLTRLLSGAAKSNSTYEYSAFGL
jgi:hypothetical protein